MSMRLKILLALLIAVSVVQAAFINYLLCVAYKIALANTLDRLGLDRPNSASMQLLEAFDVRRGMSRVWSVDGLSPGGKANMGGPKPE